MLVAAASFAACAGAESPAAPAAAANAATSMHANAATASPGVYQLTFNTYRNGVYTEVSSLPVYSPGGSNQEMLLMGYVTDSAGAPARKGTVTFEYCSYTGGPSNDISLLDRQFRSP